ncbi:MAG TPA: conjugal transfer protein [Acidimicrobiia bacterium]|jgi:hypothetical protein
MEPPRSNEEQFEHIPWERLQPQRAITPRHLYMIGGAVVVGALAFAVTRSATAPTPAATTLPSPAIAPATTPATIPGEAIPGPSPTVLSEADLMAVEPSALSRAAAAQAEWFVEEYFTVDGSPKSTEALARFLPAGVELPNQDGGRSFVESARAASIVELGSGRFQVVVVVRRLSAPAGGDYVRLAPNAVEVVVDFAAGAPAIEDLPTPVPLPEAAVSDPPQVGEVPPEVATRALEGRPQGTSVISGGPEGAGWRLVLSIPDEAGQAWPMVVRLEGATAPPP